VPAAPLAATAEAPLPEGARGFWYAGAGGAKLRAAMFPATAPGRGSVVLSGGRTEPI
jgi:lysophospholipase